MSLCLQVATLDWLEKKAAAALYQSPPTSTLHDALENFLKVSACWGCLDNPQEAKTSSHTCGALLIRTNNPAMTQTASVDVSIILC